MKISDGYSFLVNPPIVRNLSAMAIVTKKVAPRIETIVISALDCEPIDIEVNAVPNPSAAPIARSKGFKGRPWESSGPLAQH